MGHDQKLSILGQPLQSPPHRIGSRAADAAIEKVPADIIEKQSVEVDVVSGASETSEAILEAVKTALAGAVSYPVSKTVKYDVVVIGGGNAGLAAAVVPAVRAYRRRERGTARS